MSEGMCQRNYGNSKKGSLLIKINVRLIILLQSPDLLLLPLISCLFLPLKLAEAVKI